MEERKKDRCKPNLKFFSFSKNTEVVYKEKPNRAGYVEYGEDNLFDQYLLSLKEKSPTHKTILLARSNMCGGNGFVRNGLSNSALHFLSQPNRNEDWDHLLTKISNDLVLHSKFALNIIYSNDRKTISEIHHISPLNIRIANLNAEGQIPNHPYYYHCEDWENQRKHRPILYQGFSPVFREEANQILFVQTPNSDDKHYSIPDYLTTGSSNYMECEAFISEFHKANINNSFFPSVSIVFRTGTPEPEEMELIHQQLRDQYTEAKNAGKFLIFHAHEGQEPTITPIEANSADDKFDVLNKTVETAIFRAHGVTSPQIFGVLIPGQLGQTADLIDALAIYQGLYIHPYQKLIEREISRLARVNGIQDQFKIETYKLNLQVKANVSEVLAVLTSAITPEQQIQVLQTVIGYSKEEAMKLVPPTNTPPEPQNVSNT